MEEAIRTLNQLQKEGLIGEWAIGGGMAVIFYTEPFVTFDVDVFAMFPQTQGDLIDLQPVYARLQELGGRIEGQYVIMGNTPVQLLFPPTALEEEALHKAVKRDYAGLSMRAFRPEYLIAIYLSVNRPQDRLRIQMLMDQAEPDRILLEDIIKRHHLEEKWNRYQSKDS
jgi:hypothetical protein